MPLAPAKHPPKRKGYVGLLDGRTGGRQNLGPTSGTLEPTDTLPRSVSPWSSRSPFPRVAPSSIHKTVLK